MWKTGIFAWDTAYTKFMEGGWLEAMQEEVTQKTLALVFRAGRLTAGVLQKAMVVYLERRRQGRKPTHGKMAVKELVRQGAGASSIEVTERNIKSFERTAGKYGVDFAVKKDKSVKPPKYTVFFKGRDTDVITQAFREYVNANEKRKGRVSIREKMKECREAVKGKDRGHTREKQKYKGQSL